ncbi:MAG TPA: 6,7-dimethyl-8-ribityllumazine synthase [Candidatus Acidoferrales bacterium]|nr:6,7-dimethyl-8-ribityllumazine synthase [Candidatus Acidoferrales bacterium]
MGTPGTDELDDSELDAADVRVALVVSRYNHDISRRLLRGATDWLAAHRGSNEVVIWVPGAFEIPLAALVLAESGQIDAIVALGAVINGETAHFQHIATQCAEGLMHVNVDTGIPCAFGVLTTFDRDQALARSGPKNNKGAEAARTAVEMALLVRDLQNGPDLVQLS